MAETELGIYARCCRLCLSDNKDSLSSVFRDSEQPNGSKERILAFLSVDIKETDKLSTMVCDSCIKTINDWIEFKTTCLKNQSTLEGWATRMHDLHNMSFQIKEEVIDDDLTMEDDEIEVINSSIVRVKAEPIAYDADESSSNGLQANPPFRCQDCNMEYQSIVEYENHNEVVHGITIQGNIESINSLRKSTEESHSDKIEFAAGLRLIESDSTPITMEPLSSIELSYIEKCKAMVCMHRTLVCACHQVSHPNLKGLLSHLRALRIWFPVFTCYHCMITFTDRSSSGKHIHKCPKSDLDTLVKLSNLRKRSALKPRLYQNYKCVKCRFMYSFHEDFCKHIDEDHSEGTPPFYCSCQKTFDNLEDYKDHIYVSCMVEYYCDICFISVRTLAEFIRHAEQSHDNSEGFILLQDDNYKKKTYIKMEPRENKEILGKRRSSTYGRAPSAVDPEMLMEYEQEDDKAKVQEFSRSSNTKCPECHKVYSCHANMLRHYRTHMEMQNSPVVSNGTTPPEDALYRCPDCQVMYNSKDWEAHKESHGQKKCLECNKIFLFQVELEQHRSVHLNLKVYRDAKTHSYKSTMLSPNSESPVCDICNIVCENFEDLESHKLSHEDLGDVEEEEITDPLLAKYSCIPCNKHYTKYSGLWDHNNKHHSDKQTTSQTYPRQCDECDKVVTSGSAFASHKMMHRRVRDETARIAVNESMDGQPNRPKSRKSASQDDEDYFTCKRCFKVFSSRYKLKTHMKLHGINLITGKPPKIVRKKNCDVCNITFPNAEALRIHRDLEHDDMPDVVSVIEEFNNKPYIFTCDICVQTFTTKNALKQHKEMHAVEAGPSKVMSKPAAYCKYCKIPFQSVAALDEHMINQHDEVPKTAKPNKTVPNKGFSCKICKKTFLSQPAMYAHQGWHKRSNNDGPLVPSPSYKKSSSALLKPKKSELICPTCNQELPNDTALQIHILEKHGNISALLTPKCEPCNQEFATVTEYENHKKLHEIVENQKKHTFSCQYCTASFNKNETLQTHIRLSHAEFLQEYKCQQCGRVFDKQASLTNHLKIHEKQKVVVGAPKPLYFCSICNMGFNLPKDLRSHTITSHPF